MNKIDICVGCNTVMAPEASDRTTFEDQPVHEGCRGKAAHLAELRVIGIAKIQATARILAGQAKALMKRIGRPKVKLPLEMYGIFKANYQYGAQEFADILSEGLTAFSSACVNGKSRFRQEIVAFARSASDQLHFGVYVESASITPKRPSARPAAKKAKAAKRGKRTPARRAASARA